MSTTTRFLVALLVDLVGGIPGIVTAKQLNDGDLFAAAQLVDSDIIDDALAFIDDINLDGSDALADTLAAPTAAAPAAANVLDDDADEAKAKGPDLDDVEEEVEDGPQDADELEPGHNGPDLDDIEEQDGPQDAYDDGDLEAQAVVQDVNATLAAPITDDDGTEIKGVEADEPGGLESNHEFEGEEEGEH